MEKRILIAAVISAIFMTWYAQSVLRWSERAETRPSAASIDAQKTATPLAQHPELVAAEPEELAVLESSDIQLEIGTGSASIRSVVLKKFLNESRTGSLRIRSGFPVLAVHINEKPLQWHLVDKNTSSISFESDNDGKKYYISYRFTSDNSSVGIVLYTMDQSNRGDNQKAMILSTWSRGDQLNGRQNILELVAMKSDTNGKLQYARYHGSPRTERHVPRGTSMLSLSERYFCQSIRTTNGPGLVTFLPSTQETIGTRLELPGAISRHADDAQIATVYFGPRNYFYLKNAGFEKAFPIGTLGQLGLFLLFLLNGIASVVHNYGVAVILFSALITCVMAPFTIISFRSMKRLQELKPQMDKIMAKHKDNPQQANQEVFALYRQHRVSPLSGCLPMMLQLPIFFALFQAISHYVELRGKSFLWISDLSLPDRIAKLPFSMPLLGPQINLLPVIMALVMFFQQKASQKNMPSAGATQGMNVMSGPFMAVLFGIMFYQFPSGLVLYWLTNSLMSLVWYRLAR